MLTATTLQLLDANNNNISPAVCVDSLYFEKTVGDKIYRMSLKNRTIVASDNMTVNFNIGKPNKLDDLEIPYYTVTASNGGSADYYVYQLNTSTYSLGGHIKTLVNDEILTNYHTKDDALTTFLRLDGGNAINSSFYVGTTNSSLHIVGTNTFSGVTFGGTYNYGIVKQWSGSNKRLLITNNDDISIYSSNESALRGLNHVILESKNVSIYIDDQTNGAVQIDSPTIDVISSSITRIESPQINVGLSNSSVFIGGTTPNASANTHINGELYLNNVKFAFTNGSTYEPNTFKTITVNNHSAMVWEKIPQLKFVSIDATDGENIHETYMNGTSDKSLIFKRFVYYTTDSLDGEQSVNIIKSGTDTDTTINIKSIVSGDTNQSIIKPSGSDQYAIRLKTVLGKSLISSDSDNSNITIDDIKSGIEFDSISRLDVAYDDTNSNHYLLSILDSAIPSDSHLKDTSLLYSSGVYFTGKGNMTAKQYYAASDRRMKTNINTLNVGNLPTIKEFDWIDSSLHTYGCIAQELEEYGYADLVTEDEHGFKKVDYNAAHSLYIAKLQKENDELKERLSNLENLVAEIINKHS